MTAKQRLLPYLGLATGIVTIGFSAFFVRWAEAPGPVMAMYRMGISVLLLAPFFFRSLAKHPRPLKDLLWFPLLGGLSMALDHSFWNTSLSYTSAANAALLGNTSPLWVALIAWLFLREKLPRRFWIGLGLSLVGAATVLGSDMFLHPQLGWGDLLAIISSVFYAGYFLFAQRGRERLDALACIWMMQFCAFVTLLAYNLSSHLPILAYPPRSWLMFLLAGVFSQTLGYLAVVYALGHLPASIVSPTMIFQPVLTALLSIPLLHEALQPFQIAGGGAVLLGIFLINAPRGKDLSHPPAPGVRRLGRRKIRKPEPANATLPDTGREGEKGLQSFAPPIPIKPGQGHTGARSEGWVLFHCLSSMLYSGTPLQMRLRQLNCEDSKTPRIGR